MIEIKRLSDFPGNDIASKLLAVVGNQRRESVKNESILHAGQALISKQVEIDFRSCAARVYRIPGEAVSPSETAFLNNSVLPCFGGYNISCVKLPKDIKAILSNPDESLTWIIIQ